MRRYGDMEAEAGSQEEEEEDEEEQESPERSDLPHGATADAQRRTMEALRDTIAEAMWRDFSRRRTLHGR